MSTTAAAPAKAAPAVPATVTRPMMKFKLIAGMHVHGKYLDAHGTPRQRVYSAGDVLESPDNLAARWPEKFVLMDDAAATSRPAGNNQSQAAVPAAAVPKAVAEANAENLLKDLNLDKMSVKELTEFAAAEEIDLKGSKDRVDILKLIKASFSH